MSLDAVSIGKAARQFSKQSHCNHIVLNISIKRGKKHATQSLSGSTGKGVLNLCGVKQAGEKFGLGGQNQSGCLFNKGVGEGEVHVLSWRIQWKQFFTCVPKLLFAMVPYKLLLFELIMSVLSHLDMTCGLADIKTA